MKRFREDTKALFTDPIIKEAAKSAVGWGLCWGGFFYLLHLLLSA